MERRREDDALNHVATGDVREMRTLMVERRNDNSWSTQELVPGMEWDEAEAYCRWMNERDYPQRVYIGENVELGEGCRIEGAAMIGDDARLGQGVIVGDKAMVDNRADIAYGAVGDVRPVVDHRLVADDDALAEPGVVADHRRSLDAAALPELDVLADVHALRVVPLVHPPAVGFGLVPLHARHELLRRPAVVVASLHHQRAHLADVACGDVVQRVVFAPPLHQRADPRPSQMA